MDIFLAVVVVDDDDGGGCVRCVNIIGVMGH